MHDIQRLKDDIDRAGYYPALVSDVLDVAVAAEEVVSHLVHAETMFDRAEVRRHVTALVLTPTRLIMAHVDDLPTEDPNVPASAAATTESIPLRSIRAVGLTHGVADPASFQSGAGADDLTIAITWGAIQRLDLEPATCGDPNCEADHGMTGSVVPDDLVVRVSAAAEGPSAVRAAREFAAALSQATIPA